MFVDTKKFDFVHHLEANWPEIRDEYLELPKDVFEPWVQRDMYGQGWSVYGFYAFGKKIEQGLVQCPQTSALLAKIPNLTTAGFSKLAPYTKIKPHLGWVTTVYRAHLGLIIPNDCALRVGNETKAWEAGKCLIFDDTVEHEAWNNSDEDRIVLLFDFVRPGMENIPPDELPNEVQTFVKQHLEDR